MTSLARACAVTVTVISCGGGQLTVDSSVPPTGTAIELIHTVPTLGRPLMYADDIALSHDHVNVRGRIGDEAGIYRVPKYGGEPTVGEMDASLFFSTLAARNDTVVWTRSAFAIDGDAHPVQVMKQTGVDPPTLVAEVSLENVIGPAQLGADTLYLNARFGGKSGFYSVTLSTGEFRLVAAFRRSAMYTSSWLVDEAFIHYVEYPESYEMNCYVGRVAAAGGTFEDLSVCPLNSAPYSNFIVATDDADIYLGGLGSFWKMPKTGGAATLLYEADRPVRSDQPGLFVAQATAVLDAQHLYFALTAYSSPPADIPARLMSIPKAGGAPTLIYDGPFVRYGIERLAQDENNLFMRSFTGVAFVPKAPPRP